MADLTRRDAAIIERDRMLQFSQFGRSAQLILRDKAGAEIRRIDRFWNRYRRTDKDLAVYFRIKVGDLRSEYEASMRICGDDGTADILGQIYRVQRIDGWQTGESRIWTITAVAREAIAAEFFQLPA